MGEDATEFKKETLLFDCDPYLTRDEVPPEPKVDTIESPLWTENKVRFITRYLRYFVLLTKHGTYIDGFAGPQTERESDSWAAKLVLASEPQWLKHFHLCDRSQAQISHLEALKASHPLCDAKGRKLYRKIHIYRGDFNVKVDEILSTGVISQREATFCLLDQRTFQYHWSTVEKLAHYKKSGNKIEIFYFLANGWVERALSGHRQPDVPARWWGRDDWATLRAMSRDERRDAFVNRIKKDLGYKSVKAWPIYKRNGGGAILYYMIHATDHPEAPKLMSRAYRWAVFPFEPFEQLKLGLLGETKRATSDSSPSPDGTRCTA